MFIFHSTSVNALRPSFFQSVHRHHHGNHHHHHHELQEVIFRGNIQQPSVVMHSSTNDIEGSTIDDDDDVINDSDSTVVRETSTPTVSSFTDLGITSPILLSAIQQRTHWEHPTSIQELAIPVLLQQQQQQQQQHQQEQRAPLPTTRAVWCEAPTGDGKTACYLLPLVQRLLEQKKKNPKSSTASSKVRALILCPTRELVVQIGNVIQELLGGSNSNKQQPWLNVLLLYGGTIRETQIRAIADSIIMSQQHPSSSSSSGIDIIVATPGRLVDVIQQYTAADSTTDDNDYDDDYDDDDDNNLDDKNMESRFGRRKPLSSADAAFERRILDALDNNLYSPDTTGTTGRRNNPQIMNGQRKKKTKHKRPTRSSLDKSLSLPQLQALGLLDRMSTTSGQRNDDGRSGIQDVLNELQYVIFDEADRLLSRTFEKDMEQVLQLIVPSATSITKRLPEQRQHKPLHVIPNTWLFSATFPKPIEPAVDSLIKRISRYNHVNSNKMIQSKNDSDEMMQLFDASSSSSLPPECIRISCLNSDRTLQHSDDMSSTLLRKLERSNVLIPTQPSIVQVGSASTITLRTIRLEKRNRTAVLKKLLSEHTDTWDRVLVFVATRYAAEHVSRKLRRSNIESSELHGKLDQEARTRRLQDLTKGKTRVLIATDVASRGLDIVGLPVVINYDLPRSPADFVHRIGRTGRAGRYGTAITFVTPDNESHYNLIEQRYIPKENTAALVRETIPGYEPNEETWRIEAESSKCTVPGTVSSTKGLAHDRMYGGIKGHRKSKKDKLRELQQQQEQQ
jgi:superfamily II DNA/RNA helicase